MVITLFAKCLLGKLCEGRAKSLIPTIEHPAQPQAGAMSACWMSSVPDTLPTAARPLDNHEPHSPGEETKAQRGEATCPKPHSSVQIFTLLQGREPRDHVSPPPAVSAHDRPRKAGEPEGVGSMKHLPKVSPGRNRSKKGSFSMAPKAPKTWKCKDCL